MFLARCGIAYMLLLMLTPSSTAATTTVRPVRDVGTELGDDGSEGGYAPDSKSGAAGSFTSPSSPSSSWTSSAMMDALDRFLPLNFLSSWTRGGNGGDVSEADVPPAGVSNGDGDAGTPEGDGGALFSSGTTDDDTEATSPPSSSSVSPQSTRVTTAPTKPEGPSGGGGGGGAVSSWIRTLRRGLKSRSRRGDETVAVDGGAAEGDGVFHDGEGAVAVTEEAGAGKTGARVEVEAERSTLDDFGVGGDEAASDSSSEDTASGNSSSPRSSDRRVHVAIVLPPPLYTRVTTTTSTAKPCRVGEDRSGDGGEGVNGGTNGGDDVHADGSCLIGDDEVDVTTSRSHFHVSHECASLLALASELAYSATTTAVTDVLPDGMDGGAKTEGDRRCPPLVTVLATYEVGQEEETMSAIRRELSLPPESNSLSDGAESYGDDSHDDDDVRVRILSSPVDLGRPTPLDSSSEHAIEEVRRAEMGGTKMTPFVSDVRRYADRRLLPTALPMHRSLRGMMDELTRSGGNGGGGGGRGAPDVLVVDAGTLGGVLLAEQLRLPTVLLASPILLPLVAPPGSVGGGGGLWCLSSSSSGVDGDDRGGRCVGDSDLDLPNNASASAPAAAEAAANRSSSSSPPSRRRLPGPGTGFVRSRMGLFSGVRNILHERLLAFVLSFTLVGINKIRWKLGLASWKSLESYFHVASDIIVDTAIGFEYDRPLPCHVHLTGPLLPHRRRGDRGGNMPPPPSVESADPPASYSHAFTKKQIRSKFIPEDVLLGYKRSPGGDAREEERVDNSTVNILVNNLEMSTSELRHVVRGLVFARTALRSYANEVCSLTDDVCTRHDVNCVAGNVADALRRECKELDALATFHVVWVAETAAIGRTILPAALPSFVQVVGLDDIRGGGSIYEVFRAAASLSHCSHSNVLSALADGVPSLCVPSSAHETDVAARIIDGDCGLVIPQDGINAAEIRDGILGLLIGSSKKAAPRQVLDNLLLDIETGVSNIAVEDTLDSCRRRRFFLNHTYTCSAQSAGLDLRMAGGTSRAANVVMHAVTVGAFEDSSRLFGRPGASSKIHAGLRHERPLHLPCGWDAFVVAVAVSILCVTSMVLAWDLMTSSTFKKMLSFRDDIRRILSRG